MSNDAPSPPVPQATFTMSPAFAGATNPIPAVIGHYRIIRLLGEGGMGAVYEAEQETPRRTIALKIIKPGFGSPASICGASSRKSHALGRLQHPGIAQIYEAGTADTGCGRQPYFAMEFIRGKTLREYVRSASVSTPNSGWN